MTPLRLVKPYLQLGEVDLASKIVSGEIIPFIGSGFSIAAANEIKDLSTDWNGLANTILEVTGQGYLKKASRIPSSVFPEFLQVVIDNVGNRKGISEAFKREFAHEICSRIAKQSKLVSLIKAIKPPFVFTTNYDDILELTWTSAPVFDLSTPNLITILEGLVHKAGRKSWPLALVKIHGTVADPRSATVTTRDYRKLYTESSVLQDLFEWSGKHYSFWFLGSGLNDVDITTALSSLKTTDPFRQHFRHEPKLNYSLENRVQHLQFNIRLFALGKNRLLSRVSDITCAANSIQNRDVVRTGSQVLWSLPKKDFHQICTIAAHYELIALSALGTTISKQWIKDLEERTGNWSEPLISEGQWARALDAERILRPILFIQNKFEERKLLAHYFLRFRGSIPAHLQIHVVTTIAEGLGYLVHDKDAIQIAKDILISRQKVARGSKKPYLYAGCQVLRTEAKWETDSVKKHERLSEALSQAAEAYSADMQAALLIDIAGIEVDRILTERDLSEPAPEATSAARSALELALFSGVMRRAFMALQRLAVLDSEYGSAWAGYAMRLLPKTRDLVEKRSVLYLDTTFAISIWRAGKKDFAKRIMDKYSATRLRRTALPGDISHLERVERLIS